MKSQQDKLDVMLEGIERAFVQTGIHREQQRLQEEAQMIAPPSDLIPLGVVHNDPFRKALMIAVTERWKKRDRNLLWRPDAERSGELRPIPIDCSLSWLKGPTRREGGHPDYPGLRYYCDVIAAPRDSQDNYQLRHSG